MSRRQNQQTIGWFWDLYNRERLNLDPPYQRRSVWNQPYRDYFIDTLLLEYPAPAIFLFEEMSADGRAIYHVVDGKQRLTTIFSFLENEFPVSDASSADSLRGLYFKDLDDKRKRNFFSYEFSVESLPTDDEGVISEIFDRINRNTARLSAQELRHAKFDGVFITSAEDLTEWMFKELPPGFPNIASQSRKQMKDVELVAQLLLRLEGELRGFSTMQLDEAFSERDTDWEKAGEVDDRFRSVISRMREILETEHGVAKLQKSRLRNQTDFYSLFGAIHRTYEDAPDAEQESAKLADFVDTVEDEARRIDSELAKQYYEAARSASNDTAQRVARENILVALLAD